VEIPAPRYATTADGVHIAYQAVGSGPFDLVQVPGWISNLDAAWDLPYLGPWQRRLASMSRLIVFDRRGSGISDRPPKEDTLALEYSIDDIRAVMEAAGSERAVIFGFEDGGILAALFAATYPERTLGLILFSSWACYRKHHDYPWGYDEEQIAEWESHVVGEWGTEAFWRYNAQQVAPSLADDEEFVRSWAWYSRQCASPSSVMAIERMQRDIDAREVLPTIQVPTLVMHHEGDRAEPADQSRWIASRIPGAKLAILPGDEHTPFIGDVEPVYAEIDRFVSAIRDEEATFDRALATVLYTDIVGSTERAAEIGDRAWRELLERHHATVRAMLGRYRGREIQDTGDGFLATFDGPARAIRCASAIVESVRVLGLEVRTGVHTGEVELAGDLVRGIAVHIGARVSALAGPNEVLVSQTVKDLVAGSGLAFEDAGEHELKGVPDRWRLYRVVG
jgi:pimeloyl-ACP methyl ester carboxylesterase